MNHFTLSAVKSKRIELQNSAWRHLIAFLQSFLMVTDFHMFLWIIWWLADFGLLEIVRVTFWNIWLCFIISRNVEQIPPDFSFRRSLLGRNEKYVYGEYRPVSSGPKAIYWSDRLYISWKSPCIWVVVRLILRKSPYMCTASAGDRDPGKAGDHSEDPGS